MAGKKTEEEVQDVSPFPEGYTMNSWGDDGGREFAIEKSRGRAQHERPRHQVKVHEGNFYIQEEWKRHFPGMQLAWIRESMFNQPDPNNIEKQLRKGYKPIKRSECPWLVAIDGEGLIENQGPNDVVKSQGQILMKIPQEIFDSYQQAYEHESAELMQQSAELTGYLGNGHAEPRKVWENSGGYTPNFVHKRGQ